MAKLFKTPYLWCRCSLPGCERQAHFTVKDERTLETIRHVCDKCAFLLAHGNIQVQRWKAAQEKAAEASQPDLGEILDGAVLPPGIEGDDGTGAS